MTINTIITIVIIIVALAIIGVGIYFYLRDKTLEEIREDVYEKFQEAEDNKILDTGKKRMKWVLQQARNMLPGWMQLFITDTFLEKVVQGWFDAVEDLLDDGELNGTTKEKDNKEEKENE